MGLEVVQIDRAVDVLETDSSTLRFLLPGSEFSLRDPAGIAKRISARFKNGARPDEVVAGFLDEAERQAAHKIIEILRARRVLMPASPEQAPQDPLTNWIRHYAASRVGAHRTVTLLGKGMLMEMVRERLSAFGLSEAHDDDGNCLVALADSPELPWLREANMYACRSRKTFLPAWMERSSIHWGPLHLTGASGCLECLLHRRQAARRRAEPIIDHPGTTLAVSPAVAAAGASLIGGELLRWAQDAHVETDYGMGWTFDLVSMELRGSKILRLPRCPACGAQPC